MSLTHSAVCLHISGTVLSMISLYAVTVFARKTGDLRNLSKPDIHMLALAHDLETKIYGDLHLRKEPKKVSSPEHKKNLGVHSAFP